MSITTALERLRAHNDDYAVVFGHGTLEVGYYAPQGVDSQTPHERDEVYVVASGNGSFECAGERSAFGAGTVLFAPAGAEHRFVDFSADFGTWVFFYGPKGGEHADQ